MALYDAIASSSGMFGVGVAFSLFVLSTIWVAWLSNWVYRIYHSYKLFLSLGAVSVLMPLIGDNIHDLPSLSWLFIIHLTLAICSYAFLAVALLLLVYEQIAEKKIHRAVAGNEMMLMPLLSIEKIVFLKVKIAFCLLTITLITGMLFSVNLEKSILSFTHNFFAILTWVFLAILLFGRIRWGWRGKTALRWLSLGFLSLFICYFGAKFILQVILDRT